MDMELYSLSAEQVEHQAALLILQEHQVVGAVMDIMDVAVREEVQALYLEQAEMAVMD
jgi:hypothetical protein